MQFIKVLFVCALAGTFGVVSMANAADAPLLSHADHAKTVDELLSAETGELNAKMHPVAEVKHAVMTPSSTAPAEVFQVNGVWGVTGAKHALVALDGVPATIVVGDSVGRFKVSDIGGGCVELQALKGLSSTKHQRVKARRHASSTPFGNAAQVERRKSCFHEAAASAAPVGLAPTVAPVPTLFRAAPTPLPVVPPIVPAPGNAQSLTVQLPH